MVKIPELLAPAGSLEKGMVAILYGADAVYGGLPHFSLRDKAHNLNYEELAYLAFFARSRGKRFYVTLNIFARNEHIKKLPAILEYLEDLKVDAIIVSDPGVIRLAHKYAPSIPIHLSTQANTTNLESLWFWKEQGVQRVNLARELTYGELREICANAPIEVEVFVHGAMCVSYSGRCLLSAMMTGRSANLGLCTHPCRWSYGLVETSRPGEVFTITEEGGETFILNSKDLCLLERLGDILLLPVDSLKIEGRMKSFLYVATTTMVYRNAIDAWATGNVTSERITSWMEELSCVSHRPYTWGMLFPGGGGTESPVQYERNYALAALVMNPPEVRLDLPVVEDMVYLRVRRQIRVGDELTFLYPDEHRVRLIVEKMERPDGTCIDTANPGMVIRLPVSFETFSYQVVRVRVREDR